MKKLLFVVLALGVELGVAYAGEPAAWQDLETIFLICRHPGEATPEDDLRQYAEAMKLTNAEMSALLIEMAERGIGNGADETRKRLAQNAIWALGGFGSETEYAFVWNVMRNTQDADLHKTAVRIAIRMMPDRWEAMVREVASDKRYDHLTRFNAYEEAFRLGMRGDKQTRIHVGEVLAELLAEEESKGNQIGMQRWLEELKAH